MAFASSSASFFEVRDENQNQMMLQQQPSAAAAPPQKKRRNQPGNPNPDAEVIALSPKTLMATNRFICEVCNKTHLGLSVTSLESRNTTHESTARRSGSVKSARNDMQFNPTGKLIRRSVAHANTDVIAALYSPGEIASSRIEHSVMHLLKRLRDTHRV
jgi:hypothetical protein